MPQDLPTKEGESRYDLALNIGGINFDSLQEKL